MRREPNGPSSAVESGRTREGCGNAGYSFTGQIGRYVARCRCGWQTTPRTTYDRAQAALRAHMASEPAEPRSRGLTSLDDVIARFGFTREQLATMPDPENVDATEQSRDLLEGEDRR
jgi:phytoene/squalene synthetase